MPGEHLHFVTGRLAEKALLRQLGPLAEKIGFEYSVSTLPITVAALMTTGWISKRLSVPDAARRIILPGYCEGDLDEITRATGKPAERGPRDLRQLPEFFGQSQAAEDFGRHDIQILAEINHAPRWQRHEFVAEAQRLQAAGADLIDVGCLPGEPWPQVSEYVAALRDVGLRVSIDSLNPREIEPAVRAGAELVLSVHRGNLHAAPDWGCEVVVIPDDPRNLDELQDVIEFLAIRNVPLRIDPILEPIGCGLARSLGRYLDTRRRYPDAEMMMGIGNLTELTDVDSAGINFLLLGFCQEVGIRSVLTTQVINWARTSVQECARARQMVHYAVEHQQPPKNLAPDLIMLRDPRLREYGAETIAELATRIKDHNYRLFAERGELHLLGGGRHLHDTDPFRLFQQLLDSHPPNLDRSHAFYLGYELAKATTALQLGKQYEQDEALDWGFLTVPETHHRLPAEPRRKQ